VVVTVVIAVNVLMLILVVAAGVGLPRVAIVRARIALVGVAVIVTVVVARLLVDPLSLVAVVGFSVCIGSRLRLVAAVAAYVFRVQYLWGFGRTLREAPTS
jgi:hypothetical protein